MRRLSEAEAEDAFDNAARYFLGISGDEFLARWDRGEFDDADNPEALTVSMMVPASRLA